jgi:hypothetical protein
MAPDATNNSDVQKTTDKHFGGKWEKAGNGARTTNTSQKNC